MRGRPDERVSGPEADLLLAVVLIAVSQFSILAGYTHEGARAVTMPVALAVAAVIAVRRRAPLVVAGVFLMGSVAQALLATRPLTSLWGLVILVIVGYSVGAYADRRTAVSGGLMILTGTWVSTLLDPLSSGSDRAFAPLVLVGAPWLAGRLVRRSRGQAGRLDRLNAELERRRAGDVQRAVEQERARIARELHDIVAHSISVMVVQAGAAEQLRPAGGAEADALRSIRETGKGALVEMRRLLGVLRPDADEPTLGPQPGLADLPELVQHSRTAGMRVDVQLADDLPVLAPGPDLTAYRVVQEALTNCLKHGGGAVRVRVRFDGAALLIDVHDDVPPGSPDAQVGGAGHGLIGMRERLALYGGALEAGPGPGGAWRVRAQMPVSDESRA